MNQSRYWKTTGLVLKHFTSGEYDRRVMLFLKEQGKIAAKARGAKKITSPFTGRLSPLNVCQLLLYRTPQNTWTVTQCETLTIFENIKQDLEKSAAALGMLDVIYRCTEQHLPSSELFALSMESLEILEKMKKKSKIQFLFQIFQIKTLDILGVLPSFAICTHCHKKITMETLENWHPLAICCKNCEEKMAPKTDFQKKHIKLLNFIRKTGTEESLKIQLKPEEEKTLTRILRILWGEQMFSLPKSFDVLESLHA